MIELPVDRLKPGMVSAQGIYHANGINRVMTKTVLTARHIERMVRYGIRFLTVTSFDRRVQIAPPTPLMSSHLKSRIVAGFRSQRDSIIEEKAIDEEVLNKAARLIIRDIDHRHNEPFFPAERRTRDIYTYGHCTNVAALAVDLARKLGMNDEEVFLLARAAILHDIGKLILPTDVLNKPSGLTDEEYAAVKNHSAQGEMIVRQLHLTDGDAMARIVRSHHERVDGRGYPDGLKGDEVDLFARIMMIADVYDALTNDRPYKKAFHASDAWHIMTMDSPGMFDQKMLDLFFDGVAVYPVGTVVLTNKGHAIVVDVKYRQTFRPVVLLFTDVRGMALDPVRIDMAEDDSIHILRIVDGIDLVFLIAELGSDPELLLTMRRYAEPPHQRESAPVRQGMRPGMRESKKEYLSVGEKSDSTRLRPVGSVPRMARRAARSYGDTLGQRAF